MPRRKKRSAADVSTLLIEAREKVMLAQKCGSVLPLLDAEKKVDAAIAAIADASDDTQELHLLDAKKALGSAARTGVRSYYTQALESISKARAIAQDGDETATEPDKKPKKGRSKRKSRAGEQPEREVEDV